MSDPVLVDDAPEPGQDTPALLGAVLVRLDRSADWLRDPALDPAWVVHEVRKDLKRVRALLRLASAEVSTRKHEKAVALAARQLSDLRDADALAETLDRLAARAAGDAETAAALDDARAWLTERRGGSGGPTGLPAEVAGPVSDELARIADTLRPRRFGALDAVALDAGLAHSRAEAARAWRRVAKKPSGKRLHELRKAVKRELYQRELCGRPFESMDQLLLKQLADVLGEIQDLEVLRGALQGEGAWHGRLRKLARATRRELEARAGRLAEARYGEPGR